MRSRCIFKIILVVIAVLGLINRTADAKSTESSADFQFKKKKIKVRDVPLEVEIADTPELGARGLMFRGELPEGKGMLFVFEEESIRSFWMKNTFIPLSIGFFNSQKKLVNIQDMEPAKSEMQKDLPSYQSSGPAMYALEVPLGWFRKHKIKKGDAFSGL